MSSAKSNTRQNQVFGEINITPLTDIFLVLLIIMMVVAPMMQSFRGDIKPPTVEGGTPIEQGKLTVEVTQEGLYYIDGAKVTPENLLSALEEQIKGLGEEVSKENRTLVVRADGSTKNKTIIALFEAARDAGFHKLTLAGQNKKSTSTAVEKKREGSFPKAPDPGFARKEAF